MDEMELQESGRTQSHQDCPPFHDHSHIADEQLPQQQQQTFYFPDSLPYHASCHHDQHLESDSKVKVEDFVNDLYGEGPACPEVFGLHPSASISTPLRLSDLELAKSWAAPNTYHYENGSHLLQPVRYNSYPASYYSFDAVSPPYSTNRPFDDGFVSSPWPSSPEVAHSRPMVYTEDDEENPDDKPYARLIYEALMQAPGHRMMLRDIYEWFRLNTIKAQDNGTNGWQNSIRHNLSMNKAFENDKEQSQGGARKANSMWILTEDAVKNGVQSTTRYRKTGGAKRSLSGRSPALQRQRSGARGGRAARRNARARRHDQQAFAHPSPLYGPATPSYSDTSDYQSIELFDGRPPYTSYPMTPADEYLQSIHESNQHMYFAPHTSLPAPVDQGLLFNPNLQKQDLLFQTGPEQYGGEFVGYVHE